MARVEGILDALVAKPREAERLATDVASMRARIEREKRAAGPFDIKLARGGLTDCEFAAQFLVLGGLGRVAGETTLEILQRAAESGRLAPAEGERLVLSTALQGSLLQLERVAGLRSFSPETAPEALKGLMVDSANRVLTDIGVGAERGGVLSFEELASLLADVQAKTRMALESVLGVEVG
jgi:glutamate-ammonia-ligase adenylyltransferase